MADVREELREELSPGDMDEVFDSTTYDIGRQVLGDIGCFFGHPLFSH